MDNMEQSEISDRIRDLLHERRITQAQLEGMMDLPPRYISKILRGAVKMKADTLFSILEALEVPPVEFFADEISDQQLPEAEHLPLGDQIRLGLIEPLPQDQMPIFEDSVEIMRSVLREELASLGNLAEAAQIDIDINGLNFTVPPLVHGKLAAGHGAIHQAEDDHQRYAFRPSFLRHLAGGQDPQPGRFVLAKVAKELHVGGSMAPAIQPGALLLVDRGTDPNGSHNFLPRLNGSVFFVNLPDDDAQVCKRVHLHGDQLILTSDAPGYEPIVLDMNGLRMRDIVIGRVRWVGQEMD